MSTDMSSSPEAAVTAENIFRSPPLRFLGYANEVGEAFRPLAPLPFVIGTYIVAGIYVFCDCGNIYKLASKGNKIKEEEEEKALELLPTHHAHALANKSKIVSAEVQSVDAIIWQTLASVFIPGLTINLLVKVSASTITNYFPPIPKPLPSSSAPSKTMKVVIPKKGHVIPLSMSTFFTRKSIPTAIGLLAIPFIIHPIDHMTDYLLDNSIRKFY